MSYCSTNRVSASTTLSQVRDIVALLGYKRINDRLKLPGRVGAYYWFDNEDYRSFSGIELDIFRDSLGALEVSTRSTASRSYWDLSHQNRTIKTLRDLLGGDFVTDAGRNRYWRSEDQPPSALNSGCGLALVTFRNGVTAAKLYFGFRQFAGELARPVPTGIRVMDQWNPRLLSNNMQLPYLIAVWEEYFRATFAACLSVSDQIESVIKQAKLGPSEIGRVGSRSQRFERIVSEGFSFQRPSVITKNFRHLDDKLDLAGELRRPYRRRKTSLFDSIERLVEVRNEFVHTGEMDLRFSDARLAAAVSDLEAAVGRVYACVADHYKFPLAPL